MPTSTPNSPVQLQSQAQAGPSTVLDPSTIAVASSSSTAEAGHAAAPSPSAAPPAAVPTPASKEPHLMRIATQGKIRNYREFALRFLQEHPSRPLVLHTLPPLQSALAPVPARSASTDGVKTKKPKAPATATIPMLVSTVENVKRAYLELYSVSLVKGKGRELEHSRPLPGLWQYNETGCLEDLEEYRSRGSEATRDPVSEANRAFERLKSALESKAGPKMAHTPYMRITLSTRPLSALAGQKHVTSQPIPLPKPPKRTKAKARAHRRALREESRNQAEAAVTGNAPPLAAPDASADAPGNVAGGPLTALAGKIADAARAGKEKRRPVDALEKAGSTKKKRIET